MASGPVNLPIELQKELATCLDYLIYNTRQAISTELQLNGVNPESFMDQAMGYSIQFTVNNCPHHGHEVVSACCEVIYPDDFDTSPLDNIGF